MDGDIRNVIILGSGPAGLTAATYVARANLKPLVIAGQQWGGQLMETTEVENFPGFPKGIMGPQLMEEMKAQAERFGAEMVMADATAVDFKSSPFTVTTTDKTYSAHSVIIATGALANWLRIPGEEQYRGHGVSACATCDGFFFKDKKVAVVGGGDASIEEAIFLTKFASEVVLLARAECEDKLRASVYMRNKAKATPKLTIRCNTVVTEVLGDGKAMTSLKIQNVATKEETTEEFGGMFVAIGHSPATAIFKGQLEVEPKAGYLVVQDGVKTSVEGVFVAGDVADWRYRQAITAAGLGCTAALEAEKYLTHCGLPHTQ
jgi:thioredoxin reductase (NADPH)